MKRRREVVWTLTELRAALAVRWVLVTLCPRAIVARASRR